MSTKLPFGLKSHEVTEVIIERSYETREFLGRVKKGDDARRERERLEYEKVRAQRRAVDRMARWANEVMAARMKAQTERMTQSVFYSFRV